MSSLKLIEVPEGGNRISNSQNEVLVSRGLISFTGIIAYHPNTKFTYLAHCHTWDNEGLGENRHPEFNFETVKSTLSPLFGKSGLEILLVDPVNKKCNFTYDVEKWVKVLNSGSFFHLNSLNRFDSKTHPFDTESKHNNQNFNGSFGIDTEGNLYQYSRQFLGLYGKDSYSKMDLNSLDINILDYDLQRSKFNLELPMFRPFRRQSPPSEFQAQLQ